MGGIIIPTALVGMGRREASWPAHRDPSLSAVSSAEMTGGAPRGGGVGGWERGITLPALNMRLQVGGTWASQTWGAQNSFPSGHKTSVLTSAQVDCASNSGAPHPRPAQSSGPGHLKLVQLRVWLWTPEALQELASAGQICRHEPCFCNLTCQLQGLGTWGLPLGNLQLLSENKVAPGALALEDEHSPRARHALSRDLRGPSPRG